MLQTNGVGKARDSEREAETEMRDEVGQTAEELRVLQGAGATGGGGVVKASEEAIGKLEAGSTEAQNKCTERNSHMTLGCVWWYVRIGKLLRATSRPHTSCGTKPADSSGAQHLQLFRLRRRMNIELNFPPNFEGLVLGCIDADFIK